MLRYVQLARVKELSSRVRAQLYAAARAGRYGTDDRVVLADLRGQQLTALGAFRVAATSDQIRRYDETSVSAAFLVATHLEERSLPASGCRRRCCRRSSGGSPASNARSCCVSLRRACSTTPCGRPTTPATTSCGTPCWSSAGRHRPAGRPADLAARRPVGRPVDAVAAQSGAADRPGRAAGRAGPPEDRPRWVPTIDVSPAVVRSLDEIGELAEAFVAVHRSAVTVAVEQALMRRNVNAMFVNLARRSQVLVERQLELLDDLEREESDPDQLENLFKLDHLAARMRRNDESLLVLAGTDSTRRWNRPVRLGAVLLAAAAEIEQYQRIRIESVADVYVVGHAVGELVHLLAELLENATAFSRPDTVVVVTARAEGSVTLIEIVDRGLGMSPDALVEANAVLASPPAADVAAVERMGLFVVSHLAARLGVQVRLDGGEGGLVARLAMPETMLAPSAGWSWTHRPRRGCWRRARPGSGRREARASRQAGAAGPGVAARELRWPVGRRASPCHARAVRCRYAPRTC
ncbi:nitrate- and nitrite sensing domain-containing protein [Micromonospora sp. M12]